MVGRVGGTGAAPVIHLSREARLGRRKWQVLEEALGSLQSQHHSAVFVTLRMLSEIECFLGVGREECLGLMSLGCEASEKVM